MLKHSKTKSYRSKLILIFAIIAILVSASLIVAGILLERNIYASSKHTMESLEDVSIYALRSSLDEIARTIDYLSVNDSVLDWVESNIGSAEYYYSALLVYQELGRRTPSSRFSFTNYSIAITSTEPDSFVITTNGTMNKKNYLSSLSPDFASQQLDPGVRLSDDGLIMLITLYRNLSEDILVFHIAIPLSLISPQNNSDILMAVTDGNGSVVMCPDELYDTLFSLDMKTLADGRSGHDGFSIRKQSFPYFNFAIIYAHDVKRLHSILILALFIPFILIFTIFLAYRVQRNLYEPVKQTYEKLRDLDTDDGGNEFDTIIAKCHEAENISHKLEEMSEKLQNATDVQKYRAYIRGVETYDSPQEDEEAYFTLSILTTGSMAEDRQMPLYLRINSMSRKIPHLHFILMDNGSAVLICKSDNEDECYSFLYKTLKEYTALDEYADMQAAITPTVKGWKEIRHSYLKAQDIMDSRYIARDKIILTEADAAENTGIMRYPVAEERKLINAILAASPSTLEIFDSIVSANLDSDRFLLENEYKMLASALASTVTRVFREMKEDSALVPSFRDNDDPAKIITQVRSTLTDYIERKSIENNLKYDYVVEEMKKYIHTHYSEPIMLIDLSEKFNLSPKYCSEVFNRLSGDTFKNYLNRYRIDKARKKIEEDSSIRISALASMVGFTSSNTFIRVFEKYMGITPKQYADSIVGNKM